MELLRIGLNERWFLQSCVDIQVSEPNPVVECNRRGYKYDNKGPEVQLSSDQSQSIDKINKNAYSECQGVGEDGIDEARNRDGGECYKKLHPGQKPNCKLRSV